MNYSYAQSTPSSSNNNSPNFSETTLPHLQPLILPSPPTPQTTSSSSNSNLPPLPTHNFIPSTGSTMSDFFTSNQSNGGFGTTSNYSAINTGLGTTYERRSLPPLPPLAIGISGSSSNHNNSNNGMSIISNMSHINSGSTTSMNGISPISSTTTTTTITSARKSGRKTISTNRGGGGGIDSMDDYTDSENGGGGGNGGYDMLMDHDTLNGASLIELGEGEDQLLEDQPTRQEEIKPKPVKKGKASTTATSTPVASTPTATAAAAKGKGKAKGKKVNNYENGSGNFEDEESEFEGKKVKGKQRKITGDKKKKAGRACAACQKAHLTCDDARPCARCVKKGTADDCHDGARKKAKYLQEVPDSMLERRPPPPPRVPTPPPVVIEQDIDSGESPNQMDALNSMNNDPSRQAFSFDTLPYYDTNSFSHEFGSEAANLEYAILSSMLNGNGFQVDGYGENLMNPNQDMRLNGSGNGSTMLGMNSPIDTSSLGGAVASGSGLGGSNGSNLLGGGVHSGYGSIFDRTTGSNATSPAGGLHFGSGGLSALSPGMGLSPGIMMDPLHNNNNNNNNGIGGSNSGMNSLDNLNLLANNSVNNPNLMLNNNRMDSSGNNGVGGNSMNPSMGNGGVGGEGSGAYLLDPAANQPKKEYPGRTAQSTKALTAEEVYRTVTKPYLYAESYHYLVRHLKERFEKNDILRIIRALATFRPSLIALQMPLTEEDETFVERTFQRTLVELNKLISFSGTPTVVWRRTGEICLVGTEFCLLTGWTREELLGKKYIFELFDTSSVVEYYESFAKHAFESTSPSVMTQCVVVGPSGRPVPCAFCFSVRRDLFSLPFIVIGSFLPVLS